MVQKFTAEGKQILLTGDPDHGEVIGIAGYAKNNLSLIQNQNDLTQELLDFLKDKNVVLLSQTTYSPVQFNNIKESLSENIPNLEIFNTICPATKERQTALLDLCKNCDGVIVIGGKNSANTIRLYETAKKHCANVCHIQRATEIPFSFLTFNTVGITAGASTPDELIEEVEAFLKDK